MSTQQPSEQLIHDRINLARLEARLVKSLDDSEWNNDGDQLESWIKVQGTLQKTKYARTLLRNVELHDFEPSAEAKRRYQQIRTNLDRVEKHMQAVEKQIAPKPFRPPPLLPRIPTPTSPPPSEAMLVPEVLSSTTYSSQDTSLSPLAQGSPQMDDLAGPSTPQSISSTTTLIPSLLSINPRSTPTSAVTNMPALGTSTALQAELSSQLAAMATQLKRNVIHFSESLEKDASVVSAAQEKLEGNFDLMKTTRLRARDHGLKSRGTTCWVLGSVVGVLIIFVLMMFLIRIT